MLLFTHQTNAALTSVTFCSEAQKFTDHASAWPSYFSSDRQQRHLKYAYLTQLTVFSHWAQISSLSPFQRDALMGSHDYVLLSRDQYIGKTVISRNRSHTDI